MAYRDPRLYGARTSMRLREIQALLHRSQQALAPQAAGQNAPGGPGLRFDNLGAYRRAVADVRAIDGLRAQADVVLALPVVRDGRDQVALPQAEATAILASMELLRTQASQLRGLLDQTVQPDTETSAAVKLPEMATLGDLREVVALLDDYFALFTGLPVGDADERIGGAQLRGPDVGSFFLVVDMASAGGLALLGLAVRYALDTVTRYRRGIVEARLLDAAGADTEDALRLNKALRARLRRAGAEKMRDAVSRKANAEETARMMAIIKHGEGLIAKRVEIVPSLLAKADVRDKFPPRELPKQSPHDLLLPEGNGEDKYLLTEGDDDADDA